jgi:hypothetical protein
MKKGKWCKRGYGNEWAYASKTLSTRCGMVIHGSVEKEIQKGFYVVRKADGKIMSEGHKSFKEAKGCMSINREAFEIKEQK